MKYRTPSDFVNLDLARQSKIDPNERDHCTSCKASKEDRFGEVVAGPNLQNLTTHGIEVVILAGGLGTRLADAVPNLPKALAPIRGTAFLDLLFSQLKQSGIFSKAVIAAGFRAQAIRDYYQNNPSALPIELSVEETPLGTGGALLKALSKTTGETLLVLNGDCFTDLSYKAFFDFHKKRESPLSFAVLSSDDLSRYGSIQFNETDGRVLDFQEKSSERRIGYLSAGIYLIQREALISFAEKPCSIETDLFPKMLPQGAFAYVHEGTFLDIGTPQSYEIAQKILRPWLCKSGVNHRKQAMTS